MMYNKNSLIFIFLGISILSMIIESFAVLPYILNLDKNYIVLHTLWWWCKIPLTLCILFISHILDIGFTNKNYIYGSVQFLIIAFLIPVVGQLTTLMCLIVGAIVVFIIYAEYLRKKLKDEV